MKNYLLYTLIVLCMFACGSKSIYSDYQSVSSEMVWHKGQSVDFEFDLKPEEANAKLKLLFRHNVYFRYNNMPVQVVITCNKKKTPPNALPQVINIPVRDESGLVTGSALGDIVDVEYLTDITLPTAGKYNISILPATMEDVLDAMEIGVEVIP